MTLDTEKDLAISLIQLDFPGSHARSYRVEVSGDRVNCDAVADVTGNGEARSTAEFRTPQGTVGSFVRVLFTKPEHAAISEIRVTGTLVE